MKKRIAILIALGGLTLWPAQVGAASAVDCRKGCRQAAQACADACSSVDRHGLSLARCRALCKSPRVVNTCVRLCRSTGIGG